MSPRKIEVSENKQSPFKRIVFRTILRNGVSEKGVVIKMEIRNLTCINCPMGCPLTVELEGDEVLSVSGNTCKRGDTYARKEVTSPTRIVTTTVKVTGGKSGMVSVKTREDIPKGKIFECVRALKDVQIKAPVRIGDVIVTNVADTGTDIVATGNVEIS